MNADYHIDAPLIRIVELDAEFRQRMASLLREQGWQVSCYPYGDMLLRFDDLGRCGVVISAVYTPYIGGLELLGLLKKKRPGMPVILIAENNDVDKAVRAMKSGATNYLLRVEVLKSLVTVVREALESSHQETPLEKFERDLQTVSSRELEALEWLSQGYDTREVAEKMGIQKGTINQYRCHIRRKVGINRMAKILYFYMKHKETSSK